jgi:hypothetical protein
MDKLQTLGVSKTPVSLVSQLSLQDQGRLLEWAKWAEGDIRPTLVCRKRSVYSSFLN